MKSIALFLVIASNYSFGQALFNNHYTPGTWSMAFSTFEIPGKGYYAVSYNSLLFKDSLQTVRGTIDGLMLNVDSVGDSIKAKLFNYNDTLFFQQFGIYPADYLRDGLLTDDGNILVVGETQSYGAQNKFDFNFWILKLTQTLDTIWTKTYSIPDSALTMYLGKMIKISNNKYAVCGAQYGINSGCYQSRLTIIDSSGNILTHMRLLPQFFSYPIGIVETSDKGFLISGYKLNSCVTNDNSPLIIKTDSTGNVQWYNTLPYYWDNNFAENIIKTNDSNYVFAWQNITTIGTRNLFQQHVTKINEQGVQLWQKDYDFTSWGHQHLTELPSGKLFTCGWYGDTLGVGPIAFLRMTDQNGNLLWVRYIHDNPDASIFCSSGNFTNDGNIMLCGETYCCNYSPIINGNTSSIWLLKTDTLGLMLSDKNKPIPFLENFSIGKIYPNPADNELTIEIHAPSAQNINNSSLIIFDILGSEKKEIDVSLNSNSIRIDISDLKPGEYVIAFNVNGYNAGTKKIIVVR